jgi:hypothetical protein
MFFVLVLIPSPYSSSYTIMCRIKQPVLCPFRDPHNKNSILLHIAKWFTTRMIMSSDDPDNVVDDDVSDADEAVAAAGGVILSAGISL